MQTKSENPNTEPRGIADFALRLEAEIRLSGGGAAWFVEMTLGHNQLHLIERMHPNDQVVQSKCGSMVNSNCAALTDGGGVFPHFCPRCLGIAWLDEAASDNKPVAVAC